MRGIKRTRIASRGCEQSSAGILGKKTLSKERAKSKGGDVKMLADRNMSAEDIARTLEMSSFTVKEYLNIYTEFKRGDGNAK